MERWILKDSKRPIGRLYLASIQAELRIVDISLLPEWRGQGIGTALLRGLCEQADRTGKTLRLHVVQHNRVLGLYRRLGFREQDQSSLYWALERKPSM